MKLKYVTLCILLVGGTVFGQKKEIRKAERALQNEDMETVNKQLEKINEGDVSSLNDKWAGKYYYFKGVSAMSSKTAGLETLVQAGKDLQKAAEMGYEDEAKQSLDMVKQGLVNSGVEDQGNEDFESAYQKLKTVTDLFPEDTIYLYAAGGNALNADMNDEALDIFKELRDKGYKGNDLQYTAVDKKSGEEVPFDSKSERDLYVKSGDFENPGVRREESKEGDIIKSIAVAYINKGDKEKALKAIEDARKADPDDIEFIRAEANVYQELGETEKYTKLLEDLIQRDAENADTYYSILGTAAHEDGNIEKAKEYYKKAIDSDTKIVDAYLNLGNLHIERQEELNDEMNELGTSAADNKKYDELSEEKNKELEKAIPYMEKAIELAETPDVNLIRTVYQLHLQLQNDDQAEKYKQMMEEAEAE